MLQKEGQWLKACTHVYSLLHAPDCAPSASSLVDHMLSKFCALAWSTCIKACTHLRGLPRSQTEHTEINYDTHTNAVRLCAGGLRTVC